MTVCEKFAVNSRQKLLMPVVMLGALFEGFDFMVINQALPLIAQDLGLDTRTTGFVISLIAIGAILAFFVVRLADKYGRRPIFLLSVVSYALCSLATAFVSSVFFFILFQLLGRIFLVACWGVGYIIMAEEFPASMRGRAVGIFQAGAAIGGILPALCMTLGVGWRGLFALGAIPLVILLFTHKNLPETEHFLETQNALKEEDTLRPCFLAIFDQPYRKSIITMMGLWFCMYLCYATTMSFFAFRVVTELRWDTKTQVGPVLLVAALFGLLGYYAVGKALDSWGRKKTAIVFFSCGAIAAIFVFKCTSFVSVLTANVIANFFIGTFTVLCATFSSELFPTALRGTAYAWGNNVMGRLATIAAPTAASLLAAPLQGIGNAVALLATGGLLCALIVAFFLPETMNLKVPEYACRQTSFDGSLTCQIVHKD